jgi:hypothetical protein
MQGLSAAIPDPAVLLALEPEELGAKMLFILVLPEAENFIRATCWGISGAITQQASQRNIRDNARLFDARLKAMPEQGRLDLAQFVVTRCYLVTVATPDINSAFRIFSVLNTRGLDLSATDILKAQIIGGIVDRQRDAYPPIFRRFDAVLGNWSKLLCGRSLWQRYCPI